MAKGKGKQVPEDYFKKTTMGFDELVTMRATSGSTGLPKICTNTTPLHNAQDYADKWHVTGDDVILAIATVATGAGLPAVELNGLLGCKAVLNERWDPKGGPDRVLSLMQEHKVTIACGVPPHVLMTANHPNFGNYNISSLRIFTWAGAPLAKEQIDRLEKKLGAKLLSFYGMMDTGWISAVGYDEPIEIRSSTVGSPGTKRELKVVDEKGNEVPKGDVGEILVRGAVGNLGYFKDAERAKEVYDAEAWYHTADLGRLDANNNIHLMGRATDTINRGGQKIFPLEIENILRSHPKVAEVAIVPMPDPILGQRPCAYVELKPGAGEFTFDEMTARMEQMQMAKYNRPERLEIMEKLPRTPSQKVDKQVLIADIKQKLGV
jgi:acyl-coenzyme A synthetase/AMP-(fatty) acid ligase